MSSFPIVPLQRQATQIWFDAVTAVRVSQVSRSTQQQSVLLNKKYHRKQSESQTERAEPFYDIAHK